MIKNLESMLSANILGMKRSAIRELLKLTQRSEVISFAGGLPSPDTFPIEQLKEITLEVLNEDGASALQYGATEGDPALRAELVKLYKKQNFDIDISNLVITTASQQGLDLLAKVFIDRGDIVICGLPSYLGGLSAFSSYGAEMIGIKFDEHGMRSDILRKVVEDLAAENKKPKFVYIIPDFQNPAGVTMPDFRRKEIIEIAHEFDLLIVEDSPYKELRFEGEHQTSLYVLDGIGQVITMGTFSKIFVPGFRIGWIIAHKDIVDKFVVGKQATDLCTSPFVQKISARYLSKGYFEKNLIKTTAMYKDKKALMMRCFDEEMPEGVTWTKPEGGLFLFMYLPEGMDAGKLFQRAIKNNVAFVTGDVFHCDDSGKNTLRINFSYSSKEQICEGVKRLAKAIREEMEEM
ncbi:MAG: PLP-dependent aminotransferase family protein [Candidatus Stygibacter australis]|nr:PLP-dependent aminotransferase family protein [Candidatus Stygibacter australis]MDP8323340.1 PLP-dependent aminotransferase family protein [Candidatus Stygibacter australis]